MANNIFQVKRTSTAGRTPNTTGSYATNSQYIAAGELALNMTDGILYSSNGSVPIVIGSNVSSLNVTGNASVNGVSSHLSNVVINNNKYLNFQTVNTSAYVSFVQQNDDNFVMYSTNTAYGTRAIWSVFANSVTSNMSFSVRTVHNGGLTIPTGVTLLDSTGSQGTAGQVLTSNGTGNVYWSTASGGGSVNVASQYAWTNTQTFSNNITFSANVIVANVFSVGNSTVNTFANSTHFYSGNSTVYGYGNNTADVLVSASGNLTLTATSIVLANATVNTFVANTTQLTISTPVSANGSFGAAGQSLISTGGGVAWGSVSPGYNYSSIFGGSGSYFSIPSSTLFNFGTGNFTIESWVYPIDAGRTNDASKVGTIISQGDGTNTGHWAFYSVISGGVVSALYFASDGVDRLTVTGLSISINAWHHFSCVRNGTTITIYVDGVSVGSATYGTSIGNAGTVQIARSVFGGSFENWLKGYFSNVRVVKGTAVYTSNFTVTTSPLSAISGTSLLTCNSITPSDSSGNNLVVTNVAAGTSASYSPFTSTTVSLPTTTLTAVRQQFTGDGSTTTFSIAGGYTPNAISVFVNGVLFRNGTEVTVTSGSTIVFAVAPLSGALIDVIGTVPTTYSSITPQVYSVGFNGSTQSLSSTGTYTIGTGDFTFEFWLNYTGGNGYVCFFCTTGSPQVYYGLQTGTLYPFVWNGTSAQLVSSTNITTNTWQHHAVVRKNGVLSIFLNGISIASTTYSSSIADAPIVIGNNNGNAQYTTGYMSNFRFVSGVAVYTNNFTVPSSPLAAVQSASGAYISAITGTQTKLLTCNGPSIVDGSTNGFTITNNGSAPVSTSIVPTFTNVAISGFPTPSAIGQVPFSTDGSTWTPTQKIVQGTSVATTSGTSIDFTNIPSWVKRITVILNGVSTSGTSFVIIQIGSATFTTSGYLGTTMGIGNGTSTSAVSTTTGFGTSTSASATDARVGIVQIINITGNIWIGAATTGLSSGVYGGFSGGNVTLGGVLDRVRLTTVNGTDTFDAGSVNIMYE